MSHISQDLNNLSSQEKRELLAKLIQEKAQQSKKKYPLAYGQRPLWFLYKFASESAVNNAAYVARLHKDLDIQALQEAFNKLIERHLVLRTTYFMDNDQPMAKVHDEMPLKLNQVDVSHWTQQEIDHWLDQEADLPFNLEQGPIIRVSVLIDSSTQDPPVKQTPILILVIDHITLDFWSVELLINELRQIYHGIRSNTEVSLPPIALQYSDYVKWQHDMLAGETGEKLWKYWKGKLAGELPALNLPIDYPRQPIQTYKGKKLSFSLGKELTFELKELAKVNGVTLYMTILAVFEILLYRYTGQDDILIGSAVVNRNQAELENTFGYFTNAVVLRTALSENPTFRELLHRIRPVVLEAMENKDFPFTLLVERLQPVHDISRPPIVQVGIAWEQIRRHSYGQKTGSEYLIEETLTSGPRGANLDLNLMVFNLSEELSGMWRYKTDLFKEETIRKMSEHFRSLLQEVVKNPQKKISQYSLLSEVEKHQLLVEWNQTYKDYTQDKCTHELFEEQVEKTPNAIAVVFEGKELTYKELNNRATDLAKYIQKLGVGPEVLVGICVERSLEMVIGLLGILKAGGAYVPIDPTYPSERLAYMLEDSQVKILLTQQKLVNLLSNFEGQLLCLDSEWEIEKEKSSEPLVKQVETENLAYVIYTSGSTGKPKGTMNTHRGLVNRLLWMQETYQLNESDRVLQKTPFSFDVSIWEFFWPLITGATLIVAEPGGHQDSHYLVKIIAEQKITTLHFVPSMLQVFLEEQGLEACQSLKRVICSGEALPYDLQQRFFESLNCELHNLYGPTEAAIDVTHWQCQPNHPLEKVPIGRPIANTQMYILDSYLQPVPMGVAGELHIGGVQLARGYWQRPELTAEKFIRNPFGDSTVDDKTSRLYKTGDLARYLPDGNIEYLGRIDHQVKIRGFRIELGEIEAVLTQHPQVREAIVLAEEDQNKDKRLVAYIVCQEAVESTRELRDFLQQKLPDYMTPSTFVTLEELPLTPNGKVDRRGLSKFNQNKLDSGETFVEPRNFIEEELVTIWQELLKIDQIGIYDNFFELGGHSLLLTQVASRIRSNFEVDMPLMILFNTPTVATMSIAITEKMLEQEEDTEQMIKEVQGLSQSEIAALMDDE
ncbi:MAG: amino acid adenylation domain-containing protein [Crocosphaera sp.]|nr:amino acid adenylation domain-containing protein [Crocosphaera sp.]